MEISRKSFEEKKKEFNKAIDEYHQAVVDMAPLSVKKDLWAKYERLELEIDFMIFELRRRNGKG